MSHPAGRQLRAVRAIAAAAVLAGAILPAAPSAVRAAVATAAERVAGADRYATSVAVSHRLFPAGKAPVVYLATGEAFPDALAAGPVASASGGAVLLTRKATLPDAVRAELVRLAPARVVVVGSEGAISAAVLDTVRAALPAATVVRIYGTDRYTTAAALSQATFHPGQTPAVFVATGAVFPDALAAGAAAAVQHVPVLLTLPGSLPVSTANEIRRLAPAKVILLGSSGATSTAVQNAIAALGPSVERVFGADRYATAASVAARFLPAAPTVVAVTGADFADAAAAVPLAASLSAPILLTRSDEVPVATRDRLVASKPSKLVIVGGTSVVPEIVRGELMGYADGRIAVPPAHPTYPSYDQGYHDYYEMLTEIRGAEIAFPSLVHVFSIGKSYEGRDIWAAKVSDNVMTDENEPEVLVDALHHGREHLGVEQALYLLRTLATDYATDATVKRLVDSREVTIIFALNPDGWFYDLGGSTYRNWRKNRQPTPGSTSIGTDINRNYNYGWGCCGGSSSNPAAWNYRGPAAWSTPEARALRDFVLSRVVNGVQQIKLHISLHTNAELVLYPWAYTTAAPGSMPVDDFSTFVAIGKGMASRNGYTAKQSSHYYVTDGDEIDWLYGTQHIFSFTWELYPTEQYSDTGDFEPPDSVIAPQTARNRSALLYSIDIAACPYAAIGKQSTHCS